MKLKKMKSIISLSLALAVSLGIQTSIPANEVIVNAENSSTVSLGGSASYSTEAKGMATIGTADGGTTQVPKTSELQWLPDPSIPGNAYVTDEFLENNNTIPTTDWATSFLWGSMFGGLENPYSFASYAFPLAYQASADGMKLGSMMWTQYPAEGREFRMPLEMTDYTIKPVGVAIPDAKVDKITDWSYDVVMGTETQNVTTTMVQGSPYAYFEVTDGTDVSIKAGTNWSTKALLSPLPAIGVEWEKETGLTGIVTDETQIILQAYYPAPGSVAQTKRFLLSGPEGVTWNIKNAGSPSMEIIASFPDGKGYFSMVPLPDEVMVSEDVIDTYKEYAYNFVTDTRADYVFDQSTNEVTNTFHYTIDKKAESTVEGILMGILPHQHKNMDEVESDYLDLEDYTYRTVRGDMRFLVGSSFETTLEYTGIVPTMPTIEDETDQETLRKYLYEFVDEAKENGSYIVLSPYGDESTYWVGKALQRAINLVPIAEDLGEFTIAEDILHDVKVELEDWFSTDDSEEDKFFYYNEEVGTLIGYPASFGSDSQLNDHHFHYGYFIYTAAQIALKDEAWAAEWGVMVEELISDIASTDRNTETAKYPYLRSFAPYESHSWASGHSLFNDGNNHESSSEAMNAWAGIILWGEATDNQELKDLGAYLYTGEMSAIENYWFDVDGDVLDLGYKYKQPAMQEDWVGTIDPSSGEEFNIKQNQAAMVWGAKYTYGTWWTAEPLQVQGINLLPLSSASFYLAKYQDYIEGNYTNARENEESYFGPDKLENPTDRWHDVWQAYLALANPEEALAGFRDTVESEPGMTTAFTYNYMEALDTYGTPDLSVTTTDTMLANVFHKDGVKYYTAFNPTEIDMTIEFSDGASLGVKAGTSYIGLAGEDNFNETETKAFETTFVVDGKETIIKAAVGSEPRLPEEPKKPGFVFTGWFTQVEGGSEVVEFTEEQTVYAQFEVAAVYETSFVMGQDEIVVSTSEDQEIEMPQDPFIDGYQFKGWFTQMTGGEEVSSFKEEQTVYARFEKVELSNNLLANGDFTQGMDHWLIENPGGASTNAVENEVLTLDITNLGGADWHVLLSHNSIPFEANTEYIISFDAWADQARDIGVGIENAGYARLLAQTYDLSQEKQSFSFSYTHSQDENLNFKMYMGATENGAMTKVSIDNVVIQKKPLAEGTETFVTTFDVDGLKTEVITAVGESIEMVQDPLKAQIPFLGWYTQAEGGTKVQNFTSTQTVYARFGTESVVPSTDEVKTSISIEDKAYVDGDKSSFALSLSDTENLANIQITLKTNGNDIDLVAEQGFEVFTKESMVEDKKGERFETFILTYTGTEAKLMNAVDKVQIASVEVTGAFAEIAIEEVIAYGWDQDLITKEAIIEITNAEAEYGNKYDVNGDGKVTIRDITEVQKYYGVTKEDAHWDKASRGDMNDDGVINYKDLLAILFHYEF